MSDDFRKAIDFIQIWPVFFNTEHLYRFNSIFRNSKIASIPISIGFCEQKVCFLSKMLKSREY